MSAQPQSMEQTVVESLAHFSPEAMRSAIESARDPQVAAAMTARLEELIETDPLADFSAIGLCVALGEAKVEAAIPVLLKAATSDDLEQDELAEAAKYALRRMGLAAFEAAMRFIAPRSRTTGPKWRPTTSSAPPRLVTKTYAGPLPISASLAPRWR